MTVVMAYCRFDPANIRAVGSTITSYDLQERLVLRSWGPRTVPVVRDGVGEVASESHTLRSKESKLALSPRSRKLQRTSNLLHKAIFPVRVPKLGTLHFEGWDVIRGSDFSTLLVLAEPLQYSKVLFRHAQRLRDLLLAWDPFYPAEVNDSIFPSICAARILIHT